MIWETTRACDLACKHCRAEARPERDPRELTTAEAKRLMDDVRRFGTRVFVFSGGDVFKRPDVVDLVAHGAAIGLRLAITPATTPLATPGLLERLRDAGLSRVAVSLDGSCPEIHDAFRGVDGSFDWALRILRTSRELGLSTQVNSVIGRHNLDDLDSLYALMSEVGIVFWEVFFLVPMGRARLGDMPDAEAFEQVSHRLYDFSRTAPFDIKVTAGPQHARVGLQRQLAERPSGSPGDRPVRGVTEGHGFLFVSHTGEIYPSGFLPLSAGNVRTHDMVEVYRDSRLFRELRDRSLLRGKCGVCEFRQVCGGCRARAFAVTGDYLESDPFCAHIPAGYEA
ncbi:MAG: radical SAM protein [Gemmatimonadota bacterium]